MALANTCFEYGIGLLERANYRSASGTYIDYWGLGIHPDFNLQLNQAQRTQHLTITLPGFALSPSCGNDVSLQRLGLAEHWSCRLTPVSSVQSGQQQADSVQCDGYADV